MQLSEDGQFEQFASEKACGKKEPLEVFYLAGLRIEPSDNIVTEFFGLLFGIRRTLVDVKDVARAVVLES
jgi:hypothetical protein